jgi:mannose-6-phosphate isomerase-like protein (cupin superfamily)
MQATGRMIAELASGAVSGAEGVTCRIVKILPETEGGSRDPHRHKDVEEVIYVLEGSGRILIEETEYDIGAESLLVVPRDVVHRIINPGGVLKLLCFFPKAEVEIP